MPLVRLETRVETARPFFVPVKVLVAPDKFKGSLSAVAAADAMMRGWRAVFPDDVVEAAPIADGGEGFAETLSEALGGEWIEPRTRSVGAGGGRPLCLDRGREAGGDRDERGVRPVALGEGGARSPAREYLRHGPAPAARGGARGAKDPSGARGAARPPMAASGWRRRWASRPSRAKVSRWSRSPRISTR